MKNIGTSREVLTTEGLLLLEAFSLLVPILQVVQCLVISYHPWRTNKKASKDTAKNFRLSRQIYRLLG